jgi:hypothetical protein
MVFVMFDVLIPAPFAIVIDVVAINSIANWRPFPQLFLMISTQA